MLYRPCRHVPLVPDHCSDCYLALNNENFSAWKEDLPEGVIPNVASSDSTKYVAPSIELIKLRNKAKCKYLGNSIPGKNCGKTLHLCMYDNTKCNTIKPCEQSSRCCLYCTVYEEK
jgi:hypothetical protein